MSRNEVKLLSARFSTFAVRVKIALKIKGVDYESSEENFPSKTDLLLQSNPVHKKVPVLIHGGRPISESLVILHYIDEVWPSGPAILPSDPYQRALARFWAAFIDDEWFPNLRFMLRFEEDEAGKAAAVEQLLQGLVLLDDALTKRGCGGGSGGDHERFFGGDRIGYVDLALGSFLPLIFAVQRLCDVDFFNESKTPRLFKWAQDFSDSEDVKDAALDVDQVCEFARFLRTKMTAVRREVKQLPAD